MVPTGEFEEIKCDMVMPQQIGHRGIVLFIFRFCAVLGTGQWWWIETFLVMQSLGLFLT